MKTVIAALSSAAVVSFFVVMRADSPWFAPKPPELFSAASSGTTIGPGQSIVVATVPANKRLVVTSIYARDTLHAVEVFTELNERDSSGVNVTKFPYGMVWALSAVDFSGAPHGQGEGVVFDQGTDVVFHLDPNSTQTGNLAYFVGGYLTPR